MVPCAFLGVFYGKKQKILFIYNANNTSQLLIHHLARKLAFVPANKLGRRRQGILYRCTVYRNDRHLRYGTRYSPDRNHLEHIRAGGDPFADTDRRTWRNYHNVRLYAHATPKDGDRRQIAHPGRLQPQHHVGADEIYKKRIARHSYHRRTRCTSVYDRLRAQIRSERNMDLCLKRGVGVL